MITAKISIDCSVALQKGERKMAWYIFLQFLLHRVCCECFGPEENVGTLFNDLKFSSFNPLTPHLYLRRRFITTLLASRL